jgi:hypothetical protein
LTGGKRESGKALFRVSRKTIGGSHSFLARFFPDIKKAGNHGIPGKRGIRVFRG